CGGLISGLSQGNITSPNYPHAYQPGSHCVWRVAAAAGSTIRFTIQFVDLACSNGFIKIYDGEDESSLLLLQICDSPAEQVISTTSPFAFVRFYSNYSTPQQGFSIPFQQIT
ncbi:cubilin, partial [Biomphalaria glabrata]